MNTYSYDLPLQHLVKSKLTTPKLPQLLASPINLEYQVDTEQTSKYDLPCRRNNDQFLMPKYVDSRPSLPKNNSCDMSKYINNTARTHQIDLSKHVLTTVETTNTENIRRHVGSIYEKLLEENKKKCEQDQIITEATFKPRELKRTLSNQNHRPIVDHSSKHHERGRTNSQSKTTLKDKKTNCVKKLDYEKEVKTKYQKILEQHFQTKFSSKKSDTITVEDIRLSKICGKNSAILKLKQRLEPKISMDNNRVQVAQLKQKLEKVNREPQLLKPKPKVQRKTNPNNLKQLESNQLKKSQSERWMSMNFHQRQQRVLSNRKQKQAIGKQQKIEEEIKPCTFKPELVTKIKPQKSVQSEKYSYLTQYYEKVYRKY